PTPPGSLVRLVDLDCFVVGSGHCWLGFIVSKIPLPHSVHHLRSHLAPSGSFPSVISRFVPLPILLAAGVAALSWQVLWQLDLALALGVSAKGAALTIATAMAG